MKSFLYYVAQDLIKRFGNNLSNVTIVFPGKRAQLYMNSLLSHFAKGPVWAPRFRTIDELFLQYSDLTPADNILAVCRLHSIYSRLVPNPQQLDDFYSWGEILLNDFDDIDKHLVDARKLFTNVADLAELDNIDYLSETQVDALREFFTNFDPKHQTELKKRFAEMWRVMHQMYCELNEELRNEGLAYRGALYRDVALRLKDEGVRVIGMRDETICFVGFNVLDEVEETLFTALRDNGRALFYWDYDIYYTARNPHNEAGLFMRHNLNTYPNALDDDTFFVNLESNGKRVEILASSTDNAQVRYLSSWYKGDSETAIILCDESLMRPVLHSLPSETTVNITMGYPLTDTAIYGYFSALLDLQTEGYDEEQKAFRQTALERVANNPFFTSFPDELKPIGRQTTNAELIDWLSIIIESVGRHLSDSESPSPFDQLYAETTFQLFRILGQFRWLLTDGMLDIRPLTLRRLIRQALQSTSIPFHGEAGEGLQVMGLLEARNLDFRHIIMLSVGEGIIPRRSSQTSLIPIILRRHFGLDTTERQDAVYAYSFNRLLQRAEDVTLVYNENSSGTSQREQSRFLRQLEVESNLNIVRRKLFAQMSVGNSERISVPKDEKIMRILLNRKRLSPTAINQFIDCPMRFFYQQVAGMRTPERPQDGIDNAMFGTIFHDTCDQFYKTLVKRNGRRQVLGSDLQPFIKDSQLLNPCLDHAFGDIPSQTGVNMIIREVIRKLVVQLLRWDAHHTPFTIFDMEVDRYMQITITPNPQIPNPITLTIGGRIDRMDIMDINGTPTLRVVDYKTGHAKRGVSGIEALFDESESGARGYYLQTFLYSTIMAAEVPQPVAPCLFYILSATDPEEYDPVLRLGREQVTDIRSVSQEYLDGLRNVITQIFNPTIPFGQTEDTQNRCQYCDFRRLCGR